MKEKLSDYFSSGETEDINKYIREKVEKFGCVCCDDALWETNQLSPEVYGCGLEEKNIEEISECRKDK